MCRREAAAGAAAGEESEMGWIEKALKWWLTGGTGYETEQFHAELLGLAG